MKRCFRRESALFCLINPFALDEMLLWVKYWTPRAHMCIHVRKDEGLDNYQYTFSSWELCQILFRFPTKAVVFRSLVGNCLELFTCHVTFAVRGISHCATQAYRQLYRQLIKFNAKADNILNKVTILHLALDTRREQRDQFCQGQCLCLSIDD